MRVFFLFVFVTSRWSVFVKYVLQIKVSVKVRGYLMTPRSFLLYADACHVLQFKITLARI